MVLNETKCQLYFMLINVLKLKISSPDQIDSNFNLTQKKKGGIFGSQDSDFDGITFYDLLKQLIKSICVGKEGEGLKEYLRTNLFEEQVQKEHMIGVLYARYIVNGLPNSLPALNASNSNNKNQSGGDKGNGNQQQQKGDQGNNQGNNGQQKQDNQNQQKKDNNNQGGGGNQNDGGKKNQKPSGDDIVEITGPPDVVANLISNMVTAGAGSGKKEGQQQ